MMNKEKTQPVYKIKWLLLPLVATVILLSFNIERAIATNVDFTVSSEIIEMESTMEPIVEDDDSLVNRIPDTSGKKLNGKIAGVTKTANDSIVVVGIGDDCLIIIDGKESNKAELAKLKMDAINSIQILKKDYAVNKYGKKGKNGVVIVETNDNVLKSENISDTAVFAPLNQLAVNSLKDKNNAPLVIIDGKESNEAEFSKLNSSEIYSLTIIKDNTAIELYGEKGKNGVIIIITKGNEDVSKSKKISDTVFTNLNQNVVNSLNDKDRAPLIIIDGKESNATEDNAAIKTHGEKGANGVIIIKTKKYTGNFKPIRK